MKPLEQWPELERFCEMVLADPGLHEQLRAADTEEAFITLVVGLGRGRGCAFTAGEVGVALREQRRLRLESWV